MFNTFSAWWLTCHPSQFLLKVVSVKQLATFLYAYNYHLVHTVSLLVIAMHILLHFIGMSLLLLREELC
jgi:hypothetical protein